MLAPRPTPRLDDHPLSAVRECLFNTFAATLHIGRRSSVHNPEDAPCRGDRDAPNMRTDTARTWKETCTLNFTMEVKNKGGTVWSDQDKGKKHNIHALQISTQRQVIC